MGSFAASHLTSLRTPRVREGNCFPSVSRGRSSSPEMHLDVTRAGCCSTLGNPPSSSACWEEPCHWEKAPRGWLSARPWGSPPWSQHSGRSPSAWRLGVGPALPLQAPAGKTPTPHPAAWDGVLGSGPPLPWAQPVDNKHLIHKEADGTSRNRNVAAAEGVWTPRGCLTSPQAIAWVTGPTPF